jgi:lipid A 3-O-deacylase
MKVAGILLLLCAAYLSAQTSQTTQTRQSDNKRHSTVVESLPATALHKGAWDIGIWGGGGHRVAGGFRTSSFQGITVRSDRIGDVSVANAGVRIGKVLTSELGGGWYRGNFEYAVDLIPVYVLTGLSVRTQLVSPITCPIVTSTPCPPPNIVSSGSKTAYGGGFNPVVAKWNFTGNRRFSPDVELNGGVLFTNREAPINTSSVNFMSGGTLGMNIFTRRNRAISLDFRYVHISNAGLSTLNPGINTLQGQIGYHWFK